MASPNVELVRSISERWECGDWSDASWADPQIEFLVDDSLTRTTWSGVDSLAKGWLTFLSSWEDYRVEVEECRELDERRVLLLVLHGGRGKRSGVDLGPISFHGAVLFEMRDGAVTGMAAYADRSRAFSDLGLASD